MESGSGDPAPPGPSSAHPPRGQPSVINTARADSGAAPRSEPSTVSATGGRTLPAGARVLIVRFSSLGDVVKCTALPRLIKARYPDCHITFLTAAAYRELLQDHPSVDRVLGIERGAGPGELLALARQLRREGVHLLVDVHRSLRSRLLGLLLRAPRVNYSKRTLQRWLLIHFRLNTYSRPRGKEEDFLAAVLPFGVRDDGLGTRLTLERAIAGLRASPDLGPAWAQALAWRQAGLPVLGVAPVAAWELKRWPGGHFRELLREFSRRTDGRVLVFGGARDADAQRLAEELGERALSLVGRTSHLQSACFASLAHLVLCNDTGMLHLAEAAGTDVLALFGPTSREWGYFPTRPGSRVLERDLPCRPCTRMGEGGCSHPVYKSCLVGLTPRHAQEALLPMLAMRSARLKPLPGTGTP